MLNRNLIKPYFQYEQNIPMKLLILFGFFVLIIIFSSNYVLAQESESPLKQLRMGVLPSEVKCSDGLQLILRSSDNRPGCVTPQTAVKLVERGWGKLIEVSNISKQTSKAMSMYITPEKKVYKIGEPISIILKNIGTERLTHPDSAHGIEIRNPDNVVTCCLGLAVVTHLEPNSTFTYHWVIMDWNNDPPKTGNYTILAPLAEPIVIQVVE
jgi:hypothetical protein